MTEWVEKLRQEVQENDLTKTERVRLLAEKMMENMPIMPKMLIQNMGFLDYLYKIEESDIDAFLEVIREVLNIVENGK